MSEARLLVLVARYPHRVALARRAGSATFPLLRRLEHEGLVAVRGAELRITGRGKSELALRGALARTIARAF
jgi:hypothetical protein